jgi:hypothetical protein
VGGKEATRHNKKTPLPKRCFPKTKLHIPSFPSMGGTNISVCAFEAFQPTVCLPWIIFRQDSSERAYSRYWYLIRDLLSKQVQHIGTNIEATKAR